MQSIQSLLVPGNPAFLKPFTVILAMTAIIGWTGRVSGQNEATGADVSAVEVMWEVQVDTATRPLKDLETKYREALDKKKNNAQISGNLEMVLATKEEIEILDSGDDAAAPPKNADLAKLRQIYRDQKAKLAPQVETAVLTADREYVKQMNKLIVDLTKSGKTAEAVETKSKLDAFVKDRQAKAPVAAAAQTIDDNKGDDPKNKGSSRDLKKLLTSSPWTWHAGTPEVAAMTRIQFTEDGKIIGISWLTGWETASSSTFKVFQMNNPSRYWIFKLAANRKMAESQPTGTINDHKTLKIVEEKP